MRKQILLLLAAAMLSAVSARGKENVSTRYYGPNAFPIPEILTDTSDKLVLGTGAAMANGYEATDRSIAAEMLVRIPLWSERVNLCAWGQMHEWYTIEWEDGLLSRHTAGDVYYSVDIKLFERKGWVPTTILRLATKSASGYDSKYLRFYDSAGYHFDLNVSNGFPVGLGSRLYGAAYVGFVCWQTTAHAQNDAYMYGVAAGFENRWMNLKAEIGQYTGWIGNGDRPVAVKVRADILQRGPLSGFVAWQRGLRDWPFDQIRLGVSYSIPILY